MRKTTSPSLRSKPGFSLVLALAVMALLVLVVLSIAGFLAIESRVAASSQSMRQARLNALASMREALGVLQQEMGPDQRISANAALLDANPDTPDLSDGTASTSLPGNAWHPHWTGSWNSYRPGLRRDSEYDGVGKGTVPVTERRLDHAPSYEKAGLIGGERTFRRWLVSSGYDNAWDTTNPTATLTAGLRSERSAAASLSALRPAWTWNAATAGNATRLLGNATLGLPNNTTTFTARVDAPLVNFPGAGANDTSGRFAWWANDHSQKATVTLPSRPEGTNTWERVNAVFTPDRPVPEVPATGSGASPLALQSGGTRTTNKDFASFGFDAAKAVGAGSFGELGNAFTSTSVTTDSSWRNFWLDYTTSSRGVLSNPLSGDLKGDLNLLLENPGRVNAASKHIDIGAVNSPVNPSVTNDWYNYAVHDLIAEAREYLFYFHRQAGTETNVRGGNRRPLRGTSLTDIWRWYQSYKPEEGRSLNNLTPRRMVPVPISTHTGYSPGHQLLDKYDMLNYPRFAKIQYVYSYTSRQEGSMPDGSPAYRLGISFVPVITLWNPFNFRLEFPSPTSRGGVSAGIKAAGMPVGFHVGLRRWDATTGTHATVSWFTPGSPNLPAKGQRWVHTSFFATQTWLSNYRTGGNPGEVSQLFLEPGEAIVLTPKLAGDYIKTAPTGDGFSTYPGFNPSFGIINYGQTIGTGDGAIFPQVTPVNSWEWKGRAEDLVVIQPYYSDHTSNTAWGTSETAVDFWTDNGWPVQEYRGAYITSFKSIIEGPSGQNALKLNYNPAKFRSLSLANAAGNKVPFMAMSLYLKSEQGTSAAGRQYPNLAFLHSNLLSRNQTLDSNQRDLFWLRNVGIEFYIDQLFGSWDSDAVQVDAQNRGFVGSGLTAENGTPFWAGSEQPYWPMISMAQMQNAQMGNQGLGNWRTMGTWLSGGSIDFAFANSVGYPGIPVNAVVNSGTTAAGSWTPGQTGTRFLIDHAYLANWSAWDYYFCSSITRQDTAGFIAHSVNQRDMFQVFDEFRRGLTRLPNPRLTWVRNTGEVDDTSAWGRIMGSIVPFNAINGIAAGKGRNGDQIQPNAQNLLSRNLLLEGSFNVNSASKEAWRALLFASRGKAVSYDSTYEDYLTNPDSFPINPAKAPRISVANLTQGTVRTPFPRFSMPLGPCADQTGRDADYWRGFRALTDAQIDALAEEIVKEVKRRGPFLSLGEFVNRRVALRNSGPADWFALQAGRAASSPRLSDERPETRGALQSAIDRTTANQHFAGRTYSTTELTASDPALPGMNNLYLSNPALANFPVDENGKVARAYGSNGFLTQADVLNVIGSFLAVRGDTFTIRSMGESPKGDARAICEIVVQRLPEYMRHISEVSATSGPGDVPELHWGALTHPTNKSLGRRFRIVSFRWLSPNEI